MSKKYYWLKLHKDFFQQKEIKKLRKLADGDTYVLIYLKMMLFSIDDDGCIYFDNVEDEFSSELALILDEKEENVKEMLIYLERMSLIKQVESDKFELVEAKESIGQETQNARRVRNHRKNKDFEQEKVLQCNADVIKCNADVIKCNIEKEIEIEIDKDLIVATSKVATKKFENDSVEMLTSKYLADKILKLSPNAKVPQKNADLQKWAKHVDLMLRVDKRTVEELRDVLKFATNDTFWQSKILSTKKLREKYDQLYLIIIEKERTIKTNGNYTRNFKNDDEYSKIKSFKL